jgi:hypothetical protein
MTRQDDTGMDTACPKQGWVLGQLTDDEAMDGFDDLPRGLQFHLNRCPSCRALADRLMVVTNGLDGLAGAEPPTPLEERAHAQALEALKDGGRLTGRVMIEDEAGPEPPSPLVIWWNRTGRLATAACILFALAFYAVIHRPSVEEVEEPHRNLVHTGHAPVPLAEEPFINDEEEATALATAESAKAVGEPRSHFATDHIEAAETDYAGAAQPAFPLLDPSKRDVRILIDRSKPFPSTIHLSAENDEP